MSAKDIVMAAAGSGQGVTAIRYVGGKTVSIATTSTTTISLTDLTGGLSAQPAEGDVVLVFYAIGSSGATNRGPTVTTAGYTNLANLFSNDTYETSFSCNYKQMGATPDTSVVVSATTSASYGGAIAIQVYRYCDSLFPIQAPANTATYLNTVRPTPPTITPWAIQSVAVLAGAGAHNGGNVSFSTTGLTSFISTGSPNVSADVSVGAGFRVINSGSYSANQFTFPQTDATTFSAAGISVGLKPKPDTVVPTFVSYRAAGSASGATIALVAPVDIQENDLLLLTISCQTSAQTIVSVPSGFVLVRSDGNAGDSITYTYRKTATASEPTSYSITQSSSSSRFSCVMSVFRNATTINTQGTAQSTAVSTQKALGITPTVGGLSLAIYMSDGEPALSTAPANMTALVVFGGTGAACSQFIYSAPAGPYFKTVDRSISVSSSTYLTAFQLQLTQQ
jgi:hypothetical protein